MQTNIHYELTDTFSGEANYSWVKRGKIETKQGENFSDRAAIRRVKKALGLNGIRCRVENLGETIALYPANSCTVCFITFNTFGAATN